MKFASQGILSLFLFSGGLALSYELLCIKYVTHIIGTAHYSFTLVLAVFLIGIGLGAPLAGRLADKATPQRNLRTFVWVEVFLAAWAYAIPHLLSWIQPYFAYGYQYFFQRDFIYQLWTSAGVTAVLLPLGIAMGMTYPLLVKWPTPFGEKKWVPLLYGCNILGGAFGLYFTGLYALPEYGIRGSANLLAFIHLLVGLSSFFLSRSQQVDTIVPEENRQVDSTGAEKIFSFSFSSLLLFCTGLSVLALEVLWSKLFDLILGPTVYSTALSLFLFVFGLGLGSLLTGILPRKKITNSQKLVLVLLLAALGLLIASQVMGNSPFYLANLVLDSGNWDGGFRKQLFFLSLVTLPTTLCLGALYPLTLLSTSGDGTKFNSTAGKLYGFLTAGNVSGSLLAGYVLLPSLGKQTSLKIIAIILLLAALAVLTRKGLFPQWGARFKTAVAILAVMVFALLLVAPSWDAHFLSRIHSLHWSALAKPKSWIQTLMGIEKALQKSESDSIVFYRDGLSGITAVWKSTDILDNSYYSLFLSGKPDASSKGDMFTQTLLAHYGLALHRNPKKIMVIGLASGITAGEALHYEPKSLDILEINKEVAPASDFFKTWNHSVLEKPNVRLILQDARSHLRLTDKKYDVILSEPSNPWMWGLSDLFSLEYFTYSRERLEADGIFVQFLPSYQLDWKTFSLIGRTFCRVFPEAQLVRTLPAEGSYILSDYLLVGFIQGLPEWERGWESIKARFSKSQNMRLKNPENLLRMIVSEDPTALFGSGPVHTQQKPQLEFIAPRLRYLEPSDEIARRIASDPGLRIETLDMISKLSSNPNDNLDWINYAFSVKKPFPHNLPIVTDSSLLRTYDSLLAIHCTENAMEDFTFLQSEYSLRQCSALQLALYNKKVAHSPRADEMYLNMGHILEMNGAVRNAVKYYSKAEDSKNKELSAVARIQREVLLRKLNHREN